MRWRGAAFNVVACLVPIITATSRTSAVSRSPPSRPPKPAPPSPGAGLVPGRRPTRSGGRRGRQRGVEAVRQLQFFIAPLIGRTGDRRRDPVEPLIPPRRPRCNRIRALAGLGVARAQPAREHDGQTRSSTSVASIRAELGASSEPVAVDRQTATCWGSQAAARRGQPLVIASDAACARRRLVLFGLGSVLAACRPTRPCSSPTCAHGSARRDHAQDAVDPHEHLPVERAAEGDRHLGRVCQDSASRSDRSPAASA